MGVRDRWRDSRACRRNRHRPCRPATPDAKSRYRARWPSRASSSAWRRIARRRRRRPSSAGTGAKEALSPAAVERTPRQLGPTMRIRRRPGRIQHGLFERAALGGAEFAEAGGDDDRALGAARAQLGDEARARSWAACRSPPDPASPAGLPHRDRPACRRPRDGRVHRHDRPVEAAGQQIAAPPRTDRARPVAGADQRDGFGMEDGIEIADRHGLRPGSPA